jgi:hypothetical protein
MTNKIKYFGVYSAASSLRETALPVPPLRGPSLQNAQSAWRGQTSYNAFSSKASWPAPADGASVSWRSSPHPLSFKRSLPRSSSANNNTPVLHQAGAHRRRTDHDRHLRPNPQRHPAPTPDRDQTRLNVRNSSVTTPPSPRNARQRAHRAQKSRIVTPSTQKTWPGLKTRM